MAASGQDLESFIASELERRERVVRSYFSAEAPRLATACHRMAERFARGGRILAFGVGAAATDAQHISVEFVHPVIVGKRALPAIALPNDGPSALGFAALDPAAIFSRQIELLGGPEDIAVGFAPSGHDLGEPAVAAGLKQAASQGMLTLAFTGPTSLPAASGTDHLFSCADPDPFVVQEVHETAYHVLWELVHVFFDHKGLLEGRAAGSRHDVGASSFLYPFLSEAEKDLPAILEEVEDSIRTKAEEVITIRNAGAGEGSATLVNAASLMAERFQAGAKVLAFGNGGSATDAQDLVTDLMDPPAGLRPHPALSLTNEAAVVTAVGNDVGYDNIFARQVIAYGDAGDIVVAISTSGGSRNVLAALEEARRRDMVRIGFGGYGGGETLARGLCDHTFVIGYEYVPRIQEAQATQYHVLLRLVDKLLA